MSVFTNLRSNLPKAFIAGLGDWAKTAPDNLVDFTAGLGRGAWAAAKGSRWGMAGMAALGAGASMGFDVAMGDDINWRRAALLGAAGAGGWYGRALWRTPTAVAMRGGLRAAAGAIRSEIPSLPLDTWRQKTAFSRLNNWIQGGA